MPFSEFRGRGGSIGVGPRDPAVDLEHLLDVPNTSPALGSSLAAILDLSQRAGSVAELVLDLAFGDALAATDQHDG
jgi:hypothetical protein